MLRPTTIQERMVFKYLNKLRESGITNMFGAGSYIEKRFGIDRREARALLSTWMGVFNNECEYDIVDDRNI